MARITSHDLYDDLRRRLAIRARFAPLGGVERALPPCAPMDEPPAFH